MATDGLRLQFDHHGSSQSIDGEATILQFGAIGSVRHQSSQFRRRRVAASATEVYWPFNVFRAENGAAQSDYAVWFHQVAELRLPILLPSRPEPRRMHMNQPLEVLRGAITASRERLLAVTSQSERTVLLGTILLASAVSAVTGYVLTQCYSIDVLSSLLFNPADCWLAGSVSIGRHCFGDYAMTLKAGMQPNPWDYPFIQPPDYLPFFFTYPAAGLIPPLLFGLPAQWLGAPRLGLIGYLVALTIAVITPAFWAARGARGLERVVVFVALSCAAIPAWGVIDRGNSAGFVVPIALVYFVALRRQRWGLVAVMVLLAALVKPQFAVLAVVLLAARQWRVGSLAFAGIAVSNIVAFLLWPRDFPETITQAIHNVISFSRLSGGLHDARNISVSKAVLLVPDTIKTYQMGKIPDGYLAGPGSRIGFAVLILVVVSVLALGRRIPPVMVGIVLLATAALFPTYAAFYYLIFVLPVAALIVRDPDGPPGTGIFDQLATHGGRRHGLGLWISVTAALSIAQFAVPGQPFQDVIFGQQGVRGVIGSSPIVPTTAPLAPMLWLAACVVIIVSYARKPAASGADPRQARESPQDAAFGASSTSELVTESAPLGPA